MNNLSTTKRLGLGALILAAGTASMFAAPAITLASADPADGSTLLSLDKISLELNNADPEAGTEWEYSVKAYVSNEAGEEVATVGGVDTPYGFRLSVQPKITEPGTYTVHVPTGAMYTLDWDTFYPVPGSANKAFTLTYHIVDMQPVVIGQTTPVSGSSMTRLKQLPIEVTGGDPVFGISWRSGVKAAIKNDAGETLETYATVRNMGGNYVLNLNKAITTPGTYTITIPADALYAIDGEMQEVIGSGNAETKLIFTVVDSPAITFDTAVPASGSTVASLETISVLWNGGDDAVGFGVNENVACNVTDENGGMVSACTIEVAKTRATAEYTFILDTPIKENGRYTLTIPEGAFYALDANGNRVTDNESPAVTLSYDVDVNTGITNVVVESETEIYNLQGIRINNANVPAGVYIINGKKVMVK